MRIKIAVLDDSANVSQRVADWSLLDGADIVVFTDTLKSQAALIERLHDFDIVCLMRERTPFPDSLLKAFGMNIHAWSPNLLRSRCESLGV